MISAEVGRTESWKRNNSLVPNEGSSSTTPLPSLGNFGVHLSEPSDKEERKGSTDSGVVETLESMDMTVNSDINVVDLDKEDLMRRQSSGVWSDFM